MEDERLFAVRLLWVKDPEMFARYQELAKPVLARHGVHIERWLMTENIEGEGMEKPDEIVITWFDNPQKKKEFEETAADAVVTSCANCRINLMIGADNSGWKTPIQSLVEKVAANLAE